MSLENPLAQADVLTGLRKDVVISVRVPVAAYDQIKAHALKKGYKYMNGYFKDIVYKDAEVTLPDGEEPSE